MHMCIYLHTFVYSMHLAIQFVYLSQVKVLRELGQELSTTLEPSPQLQSQLHMLCVFMDPIITVIMLDTFR